jgi:hypothetical protein
MQSTSAVNHATEALLNGTHRFADILVSLLWLQYPPFRSTSSEVNACYDRNLNRLRLSDLSYRGSPVQLTYCHMGPIQQEASEVSSHRRLGSSKGSWHCTVDRMDFSSVCQCHSGTDSDSCRRSTQYCGLDLARGDEERLSPDPVKTNNASSLTPPGRYPLSFNLFNLLHAYSVDTTGAFLHSMCREIPK